MNVKTSGKRFSQINTKTLSNTEEIEEALISALGGKTSGNIPINDWRQSLDRHNEMSKNFLKRRGLPSTQYICQINNCDEWIDKTSEIDFSLITSNRSLTSYIKEKYERDSKEDLCARLIDCIALLRWAIEKNSIYSIVSYAIEFGRTSTLWKVYFIESNANALGGRADKQRKWARDLAANLKKKYNGLRFKELWLKIPTYYQEHWEMDDCSIYTRDIDGKDYVFAVFERGREEKLAMESFRTGYFRSKPKS